MVTNEQIADFLINIASEYDRLEETQKANSFENVSKIARYYKLTVVDNLQEFAQIKGVGPSSLKEINEFIEKGTSERYEKISKESPDVFPMNKNGANKEISISDIKSMLRNRP